MFKKELDIKRKFICLIVGIIAIIPIIIFINMPFFGDDFSWLLFARDNQHKSVFELFLNNDPFNYFRPIAVILMNLFYFFFSDNVIWYRLICGLFYSFSVVLLFLILEKLSFGKSVSFVAVSLFSVISSHSEVIFMINCLNIIISDFLILCGLYFYIINNVKFTKTLSAIFFLFSLLTRESSVYYILLLILFHFYTHKKNIRELIFVTIIPMIIYLSLRIAVYVNDISTFSNTRYDLHFGIIKIIYKIFHFLLISIFPVKSIFYLSGFKFYNDLRQSFIGNDNSYLFISIIVVLIVLLTPIFIVLIKKLKSELIFPILFFLSCIIIYLPAENVAERFTYLASFGTSLMIALFIINLNRKVLFYTMLIIFFSFHFITLITRGYTYKEFSVKFSSMINSNAKSIPEGIIKIQNAPLPYKGQLLISRENFNDAFKYNYHGNKSIFILENSMTKEDSSYTVDKIYRLDENEIKLTEK